MVSPSLLEGLSKPFGGVYRILWSSVEAFRKVGAPFLRNDAPLPLQVGGRPCRAHGVTLALLVHHGIAEHVHEGLVVEGRGARGLVVAGVLLE
eukprot:7918874-Alexandrium_andersonii.AAC.1